jgi:LTXXQ motif family protein
MSFSGRSALAAVVLAAAVSLAQVQTAQAQSPQAQTAPGPGNMAHHRPGPAMAGAQNPAVGPHGHQMMMGGDQADTMPIMQPRHIEGRIAFLRTELRITDAQSQQWNAFADALRANAKAMTGMHGQMPGAGATAPERAERQVKAMSTFLDGMKAIAGAETALYAVLGDEQKKTADELLPMGMGMPMMGNM